MRVLTLLLGLLLALPIVVFGLEVPECDGPYQHKRLSEEELDRVLDMHDKWLKDTPYDQRKDSSDLHRANLCGADLRGADLSGADLSWANLIVVKLTWVKLDGVLLTEADLRGADLSGDNLTGAYLAKTDLSGANLYLTNLSEANLSEADLSEADLSEAKLNRAFLHKANLTDTNLYLTNLSEAILSNAILTEADLSEADLTEADLSGADLTGAKLFNANLNEADLRDADLTDAGLAGANLSRVDLRDANLSGADLRNANLSGANLLFSNITDTSFGFRNIPALTALRNALKQAGFRDQERRVTWMIKRLQVAELNWFEYGFNRVLFDLTSQYGMSPGRPLKILAFLFFVFLLPYAIALKRQSGGGIWMLWSKDRIMISEGTETPVRITRKGFGLLWTAFYFSLLSAFNIGWREINVGNWISRLQSQEYTLRATGWVRTVSGIQSLLSVYLLAIWALTYFGRPFE